MAAAVGNYYYPRLPLGYPLRSMYFAFTPFKVAAVAVFIALLVILSTATIAYKEVHYGSERLHVAFAWDGLRAINEARYRVAFIGNHLFGEDAATTTASGVPVLLYHTITNRAGSESVSPSLFAAQLQALDAAGWRTITLAEFEAYMRGKTSLPDKSFLITFDDGAKESYYPTDPILAALDMNAVSFIIAKYSDKEGSHYYLSHGEIRSMLETGRWEIGSHTYDSHHLAATDAKGTEGPVIPNRLYLLHEGRIETEEEYETRIERDLSRAKLELSNAFKVPITGFAFPFGEFGQLSENYPDAIGVIADIAAAHYSTSFYQTWPGEGLTFNYPAFEGAPAERMILGKRIEPHASDTPAELLIRLEHGRPKSLPYSDTLESNHGWFSIWGTLRLEGGEIRLLAELDETGNAAVLDGTGHWRDYEVNAAVWSPHRSGVYVWVRYQDAQNNVACNFGNGFIHAEETVHGVKRTIIGTRNPSITIPQDPFMVTARVEGRSITCSMNGSAVTTDFMDESLGRGGVGFKTWNSTPNLADLHIRTLTVDAL